MLVTSVQFMCSKISQSNRVWYNMTIIKICWNKAFVSLACFTFFHWILVYTASGPSIFYVQMHILMLVGTSFLSGSNTPNNTLNALLDKSNCITDRDWSGTWLHWLLWFLNWQKPGFFLFHVIFLHYSKMNNCIDILLHTNITFVTET